MYVHVIGNLDQLDKQSLFFCHPTIKNISAQLALRILIYSSNQLGDINAGTRLQHTVGINVKLSYSETMQEKLMRSADAKRVRRLVLQKLHYQQHVTVPQAQIASGIKIALNVDFLVWEPQQIMQ